MSRRTIALRLYALVAAAGILPIVLFALAALQLLRSRGEEASKESLAAVAQQASQRVATWLSQQREALRAIAMAVGSEPDVARRLADVPLDAPSLGRVRLITAQTKTADLPSLLRPEDILRALSGKEVASETYITDLSPAMDVCVPTAELGRAVCATLDLLELQRQVQRIRVGQTGYALAFDRTGRLVAAGSGSLRANVLSGEPVAESSIAAMLSQIGRAPRRLRSEGGREVLAGWAFLPEIGWSIAVEQPLDEALQRARAALTLLFTGLAVALLVSLGLGAAFTRRVLDSLEAEERWKTAGRIAAGITHDLGHRLAILQQTAALADMGDAAFLPRIRDSLHGEIDTLRKFVADFADLTREAHPGEFLPIELNGFVENVARTAEPHAARSGVAVEWTPAASPVWVKGDRYLLERAALNLVWNAIEASKRDARVVLRVHAQPGRARIEVEDHGMGIPRERLARLFDSFVSTKRTGAHVGMGLPNVRRILTAHGGEVTVTSTVGAGSTFTLALPANDDQSSSS